MNAPRHVQSAGIVERFTSNVERTEFSVHIMEVTLLQGQSSFIFQIFGLYRTKQTIRNREVYILKRCTLIFRTNFRHISDFLRKFNFGQFSPCHNTHQQMNDLFLVTLSISYTHISVKLTAHTVQLLLTDRSVGTQRPKFT